MNMLHMEACGFIRYTEKAETTEMAINGSKYRIFSWQTITTL